MLFRGGLYRSNLYRGLGVSATTTETFAVPAMSIVSAVPGISLIKQSVDASIHNSISPNVSII